jgi:flagellar motility protein MotE (MotC chaperone)
MRQISCYNSGDIARQTPNRRTLIFFTLLAALLLASQMLFAQSLGDVARENRDKKATETTPPKVITNATLPRDPDPEVTPAAPHNETPMPSDNAEASRRAARQRAAEQRAAEQWKQKIIAQQNTIASLRLRVDRLKASIHFLDPNTQYDPYAGVAQNQYQARQLERLAQLQQQLDQQRKRLEDMQEAARHAGMHTTVYDP